MDELGAPDLQWSYHVWRAPTYELRSLQQALDALGEQGWELVTAAPVVKTIGMTGNEMLFVFRKPGARQRPTGTGRRVPTAEQDAWVAELLSAHGVERGEVKQVQRALRRQGVTVHLLDRMAEEVDASTSPQDAVARVNSLLGARS